MDHTVYFKCLLLIPRKVSVLLDYLADVLLCRSIIKQGTIHLFHVGTLQLASLAMMAVFTLTITGNMLLYGSKIKTEGWTYFFPLPLRERIFNKRELSQPPSTMSIFCCCSKKFRFEFQFGNFPLKSDKVACSKPVCKPH